ncbi:MAG TPA: acyl-CoA dehydrogenase [candidate division Zixibacteria bacterium]|nr:acyl-CoA dehydrogenase [candidate division Zixibacteria bacterium]
MVFELTEEQKLIQETARDFSQKRLKPVALELDEKEEVTPEIMKELGELGYFGIVVPEKYGGSGLDFLSYILILEEIAKISAGVMITVSVHNSLFCQALNKFANEEQKQKYLPKMATGEWIGAYALTEPHSGTDAGGLRTKAERKNNGYVLNGEKLFVTNAGLADVFVVFASTKPELKAKGISCFIVEKSFEGLNIGAKEKKLGIKSSDTRAISLVDCFVPQENLLGTPGEGFRMALEILDGGRIGVAAQALGIAEAAFEESLKYAKERKQFDQPIANFQAIQFKLADMATRIEAARHLVYNAAQMSNNDHDFVKQASMAKLFASEVANYVANEAVQIHGGYGYMKEYPVERYFRDARITEIYEGTSEAQRITIFREILKG